MPINKDKKLDKHVSISSVFWESKKPKDTIPSKIIQKWKNFDLNLKIQTLQIPHIILQIRNVIKILRQ